MAGILETIVGGMTGGAGYLAGAAKAEQSWKEKDEYLNAKLDFQRQMSEAKNDNNLKMLEHRLEAKQGGGGRGGKGPALPKTEEDLMQVAANNNIPLPRIKEYLDHIRSGQMPTENQPIEVDDEGARINGLLSDGRVPDEVGKTFMEHQVPDQAAAQRINEVGEHYGDAVLRTMNPDDYGSVMKGDEQRSLNGIIQAAINSKHPRAVESLAAWMRAHKGEGSFSSGENVITGKPSELGNREVVVKEQNGATNAKEAEIKDEKARFERSPEGLAAKSGERKGTMLRELEFLDRQTKGLQEELKRLGTPISGSPTYQDFLDKTVEVRRNQRRIDKLKTELRGAASTPPAPPTPAPEPTNYLKAQIPKVGG
jgi:hypothetical protein